MRINSRLAGIVLFLPLITMAQKQNPAEVTALSAQEIYRREFGEGLEFPLGVKIILQRKGLHPNVIAGYELRVAASFLGEDDAKDAASARLRNTQIPVAAAAAMWFSRDETSHLQLMRARPLKHEDAGHAWKDSVTLGGQSLEAYFRNASPDSFSIQSQVAMRRDDLMHLGHFRFKPAQPGLYRLSFHVSHLDRETDTLKTQVFFKCPDYKIALTVESEKLLHQISYKYIGIPLVSSIFFEPHSDLFSLNETDLAFRNVFWGVMASRTACKDYRIFLPALYDKTIAEAAHWGRRRADSAAARLQEAALKLAKNGYSGCATKFIPRAATTEDWRKYFKISSISPEDFSEENRGIPVLLDLPAQQEVLAPFQVMTADQSSKIALQARLVSGRFAPECVRHAEVVVTNEASGAEQTQAISLQKLPSILSGEEKIYLDEPSMRAFLWEGKYRARLHMDVACPARMVSSEEDTFEIQSRTVHRDEIFALNPYDEIRFTFPFDSIRVETLAGGFLDAIADTLQKNPASQPRDALVLISGHACELGEVISRFYNLGLSFGRALFFRNRFVAALQTQNSKRGLEVKIAEEFYDANPRIASANYDSLTRRILQRCFDASNGKEAKGLLGDYLKQVVREKVRHFEASPENGLPRSPGVPTEYNMRQKIEEIEHLLPRHLTTLVCRSGSRSIKVHVVSIGFGATVPFYRRFEIPEDQRRAFAEIGAAVPSDLYGDDRYPAGRFMNRRVEVNIIW